MSLVRPVLLLAGLGCAAIWQLPEASSKSASAVPVGLAAEKLDEAAPCDACSASEAHWDWKANGYAVGGDAEAAGEAARASAKANACDKADEFLAPRKLSCKGSCEAGDEAKRCQESKEPLCSSGTYADNPNKWGFVCRKAHKGDKDVRCDDAMAKAEPGWGMCDVSVRATRSLACSHPDCG